jgi:streptogramin lyase
VPSLSDVRCAASTYGTSVVEGTRGCTVSVCVLLPGSSVQQPNNLLTPNTLSTSFNRPLRTSPPGHPIIMAAPAEALLIMAPHPTITTIAGSGAGFQDGPAATALFRNPSAVVALPDGTLIVADSGNHRIRRFNVETGEYTTLAGTGTAGFTDGPAGNAMFNTPTSVTLDADGNVIVADSGNHRIRCFNVETNDVTTLAGTGGAGATDGPADRATFNLPTSVTVDTDGHVVIADKNNHRIRRLDIAKNAVSTMAGASGAGYQDGPAETAKFNNPTDVVVGIDGNVVIADQSNHRVRIFDTSTNEVTTLVGTGAAGFQNGPRGTATLYNPVGVAVDVDGNVFIVDLGSPRIRRFDSASEEVATVAGTGSPSFKDGPCNEAAFTFGDMSRAVVDSDGNLIISDSGNHRIRRISGNGPAASPGVGLGAPRGTFDRRLAERRKRLDIAESERAQREARRDEIAAMLAAAEIALAESVTARDDEVTALSELEVEVEGFRSRVATEGIEELDEMQVYELLRLLDVTVTPTVLARQEITGVSLSYVTEDQMQEVFKMRRLGDRRRLSAAFKRLANRQGFPPQTSRQPGALSWSVAEVGEWLRHEGFDGLVAQFAAEGIDGACLLGLQAGDFGTLARMTIGQSSRLRQRHEALKKVTYAGQIVSGDPEADGGAAAKDRPAIAAVLASVLEENTALQRRMKKREKQKKQKKGKPEHEPVPALFLCPILQDVMEDPVIAMDSFTYERAAIEAWFQRSDRSPMTNLPISPVLIPNTSVKQLIAGENQ